MSQLNLNPDPIVLGAQATIFLLNMFAVKKLMLEPYLKVRAKREASTGGNQDAATSLVNEAKNIEDQITNKMRDAHKHASETREKIKSQTQEKRAAILAAAEAHAKKEQADIQNAVAANLKEQRENKEASIKSVADGLFVALTQA